MQAPNTTQTRKLTSREKWLVFADQANEVIDQAEKAKKSGDPNIKFSASVCLHTVIERLKQLPAKFGIELKKSPEEISELYKVLSQ